MDAEAVAQTDWLQLAKEIIMGNDGQVLGVNTRWLPSLHQDLNRVVGCCVVLVAGAVGDYVAYAGFVRGNDGHVTATELDAIRRHGDKISFEEACVHFPGGQLKRERYRD